MRQGNGGWVGRGLCAAEMAVVLIPGSAHASSGGIDAAHAGLGWIVPFAGFLLSIGIAQAAFPALWHRHYGKLTSFWGLATLVPLAFRFPAPAVLRGLAGTLIFDFLPFAVTIASFYLIAGGVRIRTRMSGHALENLVLLGAGTLAAGLTGTLAATLLFLPVLLAANGWRRHRTHSVVFFIFLVANIGGGLSPLGPPLLLGYLEGVPFLWTVREMAMPVAAASGLLLGLYFILDHYWLFPREDEAARAAHREEHDTIAVSGVGDLFLLLLAIAALVLTGNWRGGPYLDLGFLAVPASDAVRILLLLALAGTSLCRKSSRARREANRFGAAPVVELTVLFAGIFITLYPVAAILAAGRGGALGGLIALVSDASGAPIPWAYFVATGLMSGFLDNAPTFLLFFHAAGGSGARLSIHHPSALAAISAGATFWGGLTYIGNAPNLLVRGIAERSGATMPHFFAFIGWASILLLPVLGVIAWLFFAG